MDEFWIGWNSRHMTRGCFHRMAGPEPANIDNEAGRGKDLIPPISGPSNLSIGMRLPLPQPP